MFFRKKKIIFSLFAFVILAVYQQILAPQFVEKNILTEQAVQGVETNREEAQVIKVVDGDTIEVFLNDTKIKVRVIGIDTPEIVDPRRPVECFGKEASDFAKKLLTGQQVLLEADPTQGEHDKFGRLLRYVWVDNGRKDFGKQMVALGYAYEYTYDVPYKYRADYKIAQQMARQTGLGFWKDGVCSPTPSKVLTE